MVCNHCASGRKRGLLSLVVVLVILSLTLGGSAIRADDPPTATPDNTVGGINLPPPTPTPTIAPTTPPATATSPATTVPDAATTSTPTGTSAAPASSTATGTPASGTPTTNSGPVTTSSENVDYGEQQGSGGGPRNSVKVQNRTDNRLRVKGKIQLNHIPGPDAEPVNEAVAYGSCTNCQTFAVALQIDLRNRNATTVAPQNVALALNVKCSQCTTVAVAIQYVVPVDDPSQTPDNVRSLIQQMQQQLEGAAHTNNETVSDAEAKINAVIGQFTALGQNLYTQRDEKDDGDTPDATVAPDATVLTPAPGSTDATPTDTPPAAAPTDATPVAMRPPAIVTL